MTGDPHFDVTLSDAADGSCRVRVAGEVDIAVQAQLAAALHRAIFDHAARRILVDLANLQFIDAAGVRVLSNAAADATARGVTLVVRNCLPLVDTVLRVTGLAERLGLSGTPVESRQPATDTPGPEPT